jgi:hypothetical protein
MAQTKVVVVTRFTDYDSEFTFLGAFSSAHKAHQEISTNIDKYGKYSYRKSVGDWDYKLYINNDVVELRGSAGAALVRYKLTTTTVDEVNPQSEF